MTARIDRVVIHAGADPRAAQRLAQRLPAALQAAVAAPGPRNAREAERLVRGAAREARR